MTSRRAVFLDRDGVINRNVFNPVTGRFEAPHDPRDLVLVPDVASALSQLRGAGFLLCVVSNQPDYALGKASLEMLAAIHKRMEAHMLRQGISFDAVYYCYHHPRGTTPGYSGRCECRKPSPYFLNQARERFGLDMARSWMVGDRATDTECGHAAGVRTIRVAADHPAPRADDETVADFEAADLSAAVQIILREDREAFGRP